jgi:hypothetical protein
MVTAICECPRISITTRAGTPWASSREAHVCRRSCGRIERTPALAQVGEPAIDTARIDGCAYLGRKHEARVGPVAGRRRSLLGLAVCVLP